MTQEQADQIADQIFTLRDQFLSPAQIQERYGVTKNAVRKYIIRAEAGETVLVRVRDPFTGDWLIPAAEAERVWKRWAGRR